MSSTANDMGRFLQLHLGNGIWAGQALIRPDVIQIMRQPHVVSNAAIAPPARSSFYGFGMGTSVDGTGHVRWSHSGAFLLGAATFIVMLPAGDIGTVVLTNGEPHGIPEAISAQFVDILETGTVSREWLPLYQKVFETCYANPSVLATQERPSDPDPARPLTAYTGNYHSPYFGQAQVNVVDNELVMTLGAGPEHFPLIPWNGNDFSYYPVGENASGITAVSFNLNARTMTVENLDKNGLGTFTRGSKGLVKDRHH